jgi:arginyl-tRNA synthetase
MVTVVRAGEEVKISKRAGSYVTLRDLIDEVGRDATRYFFLMRRPDSQQVFDIDLAKQQSSDNPVYYVQYAHARICRILETAVESGLKPESGAKLLSLLSTAEELDIIKKITAFPEVVEAAATNLEPHRITAYLHDTASLLHSFYVKHRVLGEDVELTNARLYLLGAVRQSIKNGLVILGVTAPEKM